MGSVSCSTKQLHILLITKKTKNADFPSLPWPSLLYVADREGVDHICISNNVPDHPSKSALQCARLHRGEEGLFTEGPCENTFCQCEMGHGWLQTCQEGTYFDEVMCVCNWPWNIPGCEDDLELGLQEQAQGLQTPHRPQPRCTKLAILP